MAYYSVFSRLLIFLGFLTCWSALAGQQVYFNKTIDFNDYTENAGSILLVDGGYLFCGNVVDLSTSSGYMQVVKTDLNGNVVWVKYHGGIFMDYYSTRLIEQRGNHFFVSLTEGNRSFRIYRGGCVLILFTHGFERRV